MAETTAEPQYVRRQDLEQMANRIYDKLSSDMNDMFESIKGKQPATTSNLDSPIQYDKDHDVIMKNTYHNNLTQVPEPGFFSGNTAETELFCDLCEATFKTYPNKDWPEDAKINFVTTRLRDSARNWYLTKYKNVLPDSLDTLLYDLRESFNNVGSIKLAKIKLVTLKQNFGNINKYIDDFRNISLKLNFLDESFALFFYNGLHPKYQEEIQKLDAFPETLEDMITKCILFENTIKTTNKVMETTSNSKNKNTRKHYKNNNHNYRNKNKYNNYYKNNYQQRNNNYYNKNTNNNNNENTIKAQKINSKN